ncbi:MAG: GNAT family N-acetyltransferase [Pyrinomonadaceae bacterium]
MFDIIHAENSDQIGEARKLFREYQAWLGLDLCFQGFEEEMSSLPGRYATPDGRLLIAYSDAREPAGVIALRSIGDRICEMKRLFVRPRFRGDGLGKILIETLIADAKEIGYKKMRLDTYAPKMAKALKLYGSHGFSLIPPYYENPYNEILFMELDL